ncbi:hypothetical protein BDV19DRAFT_373542 [Aspergillus venezuelensis]
MTNPSDIYSPEKRRKVRKGTKNCWECKRRKVRCIFASADHEICNNCIRRETCCVSQEVPDYLAVPLPSQGSGQLEARLVRVEELLERLVENASTHRLTEPEVDSVRGEVQQKIPSSTREEPLTHQNTSAISRPTSQKGSKYESLSRELLAAWPGDKDLEIISSLPVGLSIPLYWRVCTPYPGFRSKDPPPPKEMLKLPPPGSHPVLIARSLLILATFLQGVVPSALQQLGDQGVAYREIMTRAVDRVLRLVTSNDELLTSVEAIECIMLEVMYQNYVGNLHLAWVAIRRATAAVQVLGLHRQVNPPPSRFILPATRAVFDADNMCFCLVQMDHYLSLMLGLPQIPHEGRLTVPKDLRKFDPIERLERLHCAVSARIVQRSNTVINDLSNTCEVDRLLVNVSAEMPPKWWIEPSFTDDAELINDTIRTMVHFTHYHLLTRLHLPYMLRPSADHRYDHSKITAVNSSREILSRYVLFRSTNPANFYCRGCDFLAFVATTVVCLGHIISRSERPDTGSVFSTLAHSRPSDRGMMERVSEIIESMAQQSSSDAIAPKLTYVIRHLLKVEVNAANGTVYSTTSSNCDGGELDGNLSHEGKALHIHIPYFGTINFEHGSVSRTTQAEQPVVSTSPETQANQIIEPNVSSIDWPPLNDRTENALQGTIFNEPFSFDPQLALPTMPGAGEDWDLQGIDIALFDSLFQGIDLPDDPSAETWMA